MNTQIQCWKDTLATITQPEAWIGLRDGKAKLAEEVLARYDPPNDWIGHSFAARMSKKDGKDLATKTDAARRAERKRDAGGGQRPLRSDGGSGGEHVATGRELVAADTAQFLFALVAKDHHGKDDQGQQKKAAG